MIVWSDYTNHYNKEDIKIGVFTIYCAFYETNSNAINKEHNFVRSSIFSWIYIYIFTEVVYYYSIHPRTDTQIHICRQWLTGRWSCAVDKIWTGARCPFSFTNFNFCRFRRRRHSFGVDFCWLVWVCVISQFNFLFCSRQNSKSNHNTNEDDL